MKVNALPLLLIQIVIPLLSGKPLSKTNSVSCFTTLSVIEGIEGVLVFSLYLQPGFPSLVSSTISTESPSTNPRRFFLLFVSSRRPSRP